MAPTKTDPLNLNGLSANWVMRGLYIGGQPPLGSNLARRGFNILVLCAAEIQPKSKEFPGLKKLYHAPLNDYLHFEHGEQGVALRAAKVVNDEIRAGQHVLVTCHLGINRSGLVTALALHLLTGWSGQMCLDYLRKKREGALINPFYAEYVRSLPERSRKARNRALAKERDAWKVGS